MTPLSLAAEVAVGQKEVQWNLSIEGTIGPSWLSCIQWNLSIEGTTGTQIEDTIGTQLAVLYSGTSL